MRNLFIIIFFGAILLACSSSDRKNTNLPGASGVTGELFLFLDSVQWRGPLGRTMDSLFNHEMPGLPREEGEFKLTWIDPTRMNFVLKQRRNLIFMMTLDNKSRGNEMVKALFTPESIERIKNEPELFVFSQQDIYAKNQEVMFLFAQTKEVLLHRLKENGPKLLEYFNKAERTRMTESLFKTGTLKGATDWLKTTFKVEMQIPYGYKLVQNEQDFVWVRQINPRDDKDVFIARMPYTSTDQFTKENLITYRNDICRKYLFEDPDIADTYLVTELEVPFIPVTTRQINFNGHYAVEMRGLWRTNNKSMGGPFVSYAMANELTGEFYYIEGFTFSPSKSQREIMRELETILYTFKFSTPTASK